MLFFLEFFKKKSQSNKFQFIFWFSCRNFGTKCSKCNRPISATDWVRRAREQVYHLACFACDACKRQLSTGEEFALADDKVLCKMHFEELFDGGRSSNEGKIKCVYKKLVNFLSVLNNLT